MIPPGIQSLARVSKIKSKKDKMHSNKWYIFYKTRQADIKKIILILGKVWETKNKKTSNVLSFIFYILTFLPI